MTRPDIHVDLATDPRWLCCVRALVRTYMGTHGYPPDRTEEVVLAVDEACTNAIRHSYQGKCDERLELELRTLDEQVEIVLRDHGHPAPAERVRPHEPASVTAETVSPGGLGLAIIYQVFDEVSFEPGPGSGNRVVMRLRKPSPA